MFPRTWVDIDLNNIKHNVREIIKRLPQQCLFMAVVKADGYGHGAVEVAKAALEAGADRLGVATVDEAIALREAGLKAPIQLLTGLETPKIDLIIQYDLIPCIFSYEHLQALQVLNEPLKVHVKVDTGMGRLGLVPEQAVDFLKSIHANKNIEIEGVFTHFATADEEDNSYAKQQLDAFLTLLESLEREGLSPKINHAANSAAAILIPDSHLQMVRIGIALYGLHPSNDTKDKIDLKPALSWHSKLSHVKELSAGKSVSYGATHTLDKDTTIGTVPVGYADGYSRRLSNNTFAIVNNTRVKQVGRICMDQFMIDLNGVEANVGDTVTLIGNQNNAEITADELAKKLDTINYEITCAIASRVPRVYKVGSAKWEVGSG